MLNVYLTIDVELWSPGWKLDQSSLNKAYETYILGKTPEGNFGLEYQLDVINDAGLKAVCFIEPLFSKAAGTEYLASIVKMCERRENDIQLHAHPEWLKHAAPDFKNIDFSDRYLLSEFDLEEQIEIINESRKILSSVTERNITAFRAGSFAVNTNTLAALNNIGIRLDSSYNYSMQSPVNGFDNKDHNANARFQQSDVLEIPMTVFKTFTNNYRHTQIAACSFKELKSLLLLAHANGNKDFVLLSHSAELLDGSRTKKDSRNIKTLIKLVGFLSQNKDKFKCQTFSEKAIMEPIAQPKNEPLKLNMIYSIHRAIEKIAELIQSKI